MNYKKILKIIEKESRSLLRNKRILIGLIAPFFLMPLILMGFNYFSQSTEKSVQETASIICVEGQLPEAFDALLSDSDVIDIQDSAQIKDFEKAVEDQTIDAVLYYENSGESHQFKLKYDFGRTSGQRASKRVGEIISEFKMQEQEKLIQSVHLTWEQLDINKITIEDKASQVEVASRSASNFIPLFLVLYVLLMILNFAFELTTTEKESETLETLLSVPITRIEMILGKLFACILFSVVSTALVIIGLALMIPLFMDASTLGITMTPLLMFNVFMVLLPLLFIGSGLCIAVGMFASTYKEAGAYSTPLVFLFMLPAYAGTTPGIEMSTTLSMIPILNSTIMLRNALMNQVNFSYFTITFVVNLLLAIFSLGFMFKVFATEKILFGSGKEFSFKLRRKNIEKRTLLESIDVFMIISIIIILYVNLSLLLPMKLKSETIFYINQLGAFLAIPVFLIWFLKADFKKSFGLKLPKLNSFVLGGLMWVSAFAISLIYQNVIMPHISEAPTLAGLEEQLSQWPMWLQFVFIALTPGICEEVLFRGFALRPLEKSMGKKGAIIVTALIFSVVHLDLVRLVPTFALGLAFGAMAIQSGSLLPSIVFHVLNNSLAMFLPADFMPTTWQLAIVLVVALALLAGYSRMVKGKKVRG